MDEQENRRKYYVVTTKDKDLSSFLLYPSVPKNWFTTNGCEDNKTPRVRLYPTIEGALMARENINEDDIYYIFETENDNMIFKPDTKIVPTADVTGEVWCLHPVDLKYVKHVRVSKYEKFPRMVDIEYKRRRLQIPIKVPIIK